MTGKTKSSHPIDEAYALIEDGRCDDDLDGLAHAIKMRRDEIAFSQAEGLRPGDEIAFKAPISPKYLIGLKAEVVKVNRKSVVVDIPADPAYRRFRGGQGVRCPISCVELAG